MSIHRLLFCMSCLCALVFTARAEVYEPETVPSPKVHGQHFYVSNPDTVLALGVVDQVNGLCTRLNKATGVELAVVAIDRFDDNRYTGHQFALKVFNLWGVGDAKNQTGVLLFVARQNRKVEIITGDGVAGVLTDGKCGKIMDHSIDYLKNNDFDNAVIRMCGEIEEELTKNDLSAEPTSGGSASGGGLLMWYLIAGCILTILLAWLGYRSLRGKPGQPEESVLKDVKEAQMLMGCSSVLFPIPMLFLYLNYRFSKKHPNIQPLVCLKCGAVMERVPMDLTKEQLKEQELKVHVYSKWRCPKCGEEETMKHDGRGVNDYKECSKCGGHTAKLTKRHTLLVDEESDENLVAEIYVCECCGAETKRRVTERGRGVMAGSSSSSSSSGSWGGGHSSGGGAGRSF